MMNITRTPRRIVGRETQLTVGFDGDVLSVDGVDYDFADLGEGDIYPEEALGNLFASPAIRVGGVVQVTVIENVDAGGAVL